MNNRLIQVLRFGSFRYLWLAEVFSQVAMNMVNFVLILIAFKLTRSNAAVSGIVLSFMIPAIFFGLIAGVLVDRWHKKTVLFYTNILRTVLLLLLALFHTNLFAIYFLTFGVAFVTQFFIPAETPMIPLLVKKPLLLSANALFGIGLYGSILVAYALSGPLLLFFGETSVFITLALLFWIAALMVSFIRMEDVKKGSDVRRIERAVMIEAKNAIGVIIKTKSIYHALLFLTFSQVLILILSVIGPGFAKDVLEIRVEQFPLVFITPAAIGMALTAALLGAYGTNWIKRHSVTVGLLLSGLAILLLPLSSRVVSASLTHVANGFLPSVLDFTTTHIAIVIAFVLGVGNALLFVPSNTILQESTTQEFRGRVYGMLNVLVGIFSLAPIIVVGQLADIFGVTHVLTGIACVVLFFALLRVFFERRNG